MPVVPDDPGRIASAVSEAVGSCDLLIIVAGSSAGRDDYTARTVAGLGTLAVHGVAVRPGHPVVLGVVGGTPVMGAPGYPVSAALTFDIFAEPVLAELEGAMPRRRPRARARLARKLASPLGMDDWVRVRLGLVGGTMVATPLPRGAGVLTSLVRADGLLVVPAGLEGHHPGEEVDIQLLRRPARSSTRSSPSARTTSFSTSPRPRCAPRTQRSPWPPRTSARSAGLWPCATVCAISPGRTCSTRTPVSTRCLTWTASSAVPDAAVVRLVHRDQGLIVAPGNPLGLPGVGDLAGPGVRYVNRQRGAGTRVLLDHELRQREIGPDAVDGYSREEPTHLAVAAAVAAGRATRAWASWRPRGRSAWTSCR